MHNGSGLQETNAVLFFPSWENRDSILAEGQRERQRERQRIKKLYTVSSALGAVVISSAFLVLNTEPAAKPDIPTCISSYQVAVEEANQTGHVQLVTVAGCEVTILPPQTSTIP